ncbi:phage holin [Paenibacillus dokdonensis]|uniref:Phage holin n=1 Tax=Paenibacillus dokdonensis TaxID=2567944 RepID=A0ABU6GVL8_9BACL|nr:phage holin [Paenibacillus dokdonensis]MEC0242755.1 phage holin [Paenibacillus dokdonensis]
MNTKWRNYGLWVSLTAAVLLAVQAVGGLFGLQVTPEQYDGIVAAINSILGVLVVLGIVSNPDAGKGFLDQNK